MYVITGGAGFIGSNIAEALDTMGEDIVIVDWLHSDPFKWRNIAKRRLTDLVAPQDLFAFLEANRSKVEGIVHMGAISTTTESDVDSIMRNNFRLSVDLWRFCATAGLPLVYASSGATYGDGAEGFWDRFDETYLARLRPLNPYGWSKHVFDRFALGSVKGREKAPPHWAGLKFFNVYGPNEFHKGGQRSVASQLYEQIRESGAARLFRSDNPHYADGGQLRDFVWVGDCVEVALWALKNPAVPSDLYNVGSGTARSFYDKATIMFAELGQNANVEFIDIPENLRGKYQYYTCASIKKLRAAGFAREMTSLEQGLRFYVREFLATDDPFR